MTSQDRQHALYVRYVIYIFDYIYQRILENDPLCYYSSEIKQLLLVFHLTLVSMSFNNRIVQNREYIYKFRTTATIPLANHFLFIAIQARETQQTPLQISFKVIYFRISQSLLQHVTVVILKHSKSYHITSFDRSLFRVITKITQYFIRNTMVNQIYELIPPFIT